METSDLHPEDENVPETPINKSKIKKACGKHKGFQEFKNSSYVDATLFALFFCTNAFDEHLLKIGQNDSTFTVGIKRFLKHEIVNSLRKNKFVSGETIFAFRKKLVDEGNLDPKLLGEYMDAEDFMYILFAKALKVPEFITYENGNKSYTHQILFVKDQLNEKITTVQSLFEKSMNSYGHLKLYNLPDPALIVLLPRSNRHALKFETIIPSLQLDLSKVMHRYSVSRLCACGDTATIECAKCDQKATAYCDNCQGNANAIHKTMEGHSDFISQTISSSFKLDLVAVVCLAFNTFTTFVRCEDDLFSPWLYLNSDNSKVYKIDDCSKLLQDFEEAFKCRNTFHGSIPPLLDLIFTNCHFCIYRPALRKSTGKSDAPKPLVQTKVPESQGLMSKINAITHQARQAVVKTQEKAKQIRQVFSSHQSCESSTSNHHVEGAQRNLNVQLEVSPTNKAIKVAECAPVYEYKKFNRVQLFQPDRKGIQLLENSCYIDTLLFSCFFRTTVFDNVLLESTETDTHLIREVKHYLKHDIVRVLRDTQFVSGLVVMHLREKLVREFNVTRKLLGRFMDAEEFMFLLFQKVLQLPRFLKYSTGTSDFLYQICLPSRLSESRIETVQSLIEKSMENNGKLKLIQLPKPAFIIMFPRSKGVLNGLDVIIPNLRLDLSQISTISQASQCRCYNAATIACSRCNEDAIRFCDLCKPDSLVIHESIDGHCFEAVRITPESVLMDLVAVVCVRMNHFTAFVKAGQELTAPWLYFDSVGPFVHKIKEGGRILRDAEEQQANKAFRLQDIDSVFSSIFTDGHYCIYQ